MSDLSILGFVGKYWLFWSIVDLYLANCRNIQQERPLSEFYYTGLAFSFHVLRMHGILCVKIGYLCVCIIL